MDTLALGRTLDREYRSHCARLGTRDPWFGAFGLDDDGRRREYKVGPARHLEARIIDWRHPLAAAFYEGKPGEVFELDAPGYEALAARRLYQARVTARDGALERVELAVERGHAVLVAGAEGLAPEGLEDARPRPPGNLPDIRGLLSREQYALITASRDRPVIIQGRAGSGKTTVALYRVAWLTHAAEGEGAPAPVDPSRVLIVMFNAGLRAFVEGSLASMELSRAVLSTFHNWALEAARRAYNGKLEVQSGSDLPGREEAVDLKKRLGILAALDAFVADQVRRAGDWLERRLLPYRATDLAARFREDPRPGALRMTGIRAEARRRRDAAQGLERTRWESVLSILDQGMKRITLYKEELLAVLTDRACLRAHLPGVTDAELDALERYQRAMQEHGGSARWLGPRVGFEDLALILRLIQLKHGGLPDRSREELPPFLYEHLVIDEAQDFGGVELRVLLDAVRARTGVTIVGDHNQKIVPSADFLGWDALARELGLAGADVAQLEVGHRSTGPIVALAATLIDEPATGGRAGATPRLVRVDGDDGLESTIVEAVRAAVTAAPAGHHAVVCRWPAQAKRLAEWLAPALALPGVPVRIGYNNQFEFTAGVTVTNIQQVKGLEFDSVLVVEPSERNYPSDDPLGRRNLYTLLTRARDHLTLVGADVPTRLLDRAVEGGRLEVVDLAALPPVIFTDEEEAPF